MKYFLSRLYQHKASDLMAMNVQRVPAITLDGFSAMGSIARGKALVFGLAANGDTVSEISLSFSSETDIRVPMSFAEHLHTVPKNTGYVHDVATVPEFRQRGLFHAGMARVINFAHEIGLETLTVSVLTDNHISRRAFYNYGFDPVLRLNAFRVGGRVVALKRRVVARGSCDD